MGQLFAEFDEQNNIIGFYDSAICVAPANVKTVAVTEDQLAAMLKGQAAGKRMTIDASGQPALLDPLPASREQIADAKRFTRDTALQATDWLVARHQDEKLMGNGTTLTVDQIATLLKYRQALRDISSAAGWPNIDLPAVPDFVTAIA